MEKFNLDIAIKKLIKETGNEYCTMIESAQACTDKESHLNCCKDIDAHVRENTPIDVISSDFSSDNEARHWFLFHRNFYKMWGDCSGKVFWKREPVLETKGESGTRRISAKVFIEGLSYAN